MKKQGSNEIRKLLNEVIAKLRTISGQLIEIKAKQADTQPGSLDYFDLDDLTQGLKEQIPGLTLEAQKLTRELAKVLAAESLELVAVHTKAKEAIEEPIRRIISDLEKQCSAAEAEIVALIKPYLPEGAPAPSISISLELTSSPHEHHVFDNAKSYLLEPITQIRRAKKKESESLIRSLSNPMKF